MTRSAPLLALLCLAIGVGHLATQTGKATAATSVVAPKQTADSLLNDLRAVLPVASEFATGVRTERDGPPEGNALPVPDIGLVRPIAVWQRAFAGDAGVFDLGGSRALSVEIAATAFPSARNVEKPFGLLDLIDWGRVMMGAPNDDGGTIDTVRAMQLGDVGTTRRGWIAEGMRVPGAPVSLDWAHGLFARGRVLITVDVIGLPGLQEQGLQRLLRAIDSRIQANPALLLSEPQSARAALDEPSDADRARIRETTGGIAIETIPARSILAEDAMTTQASLALDHGVASYARTLAGQGLTFPLGESAIIELSTSAALHPTPVSALRRVEEFESAGADDFLSMFGDSLVTVSAHEIAGYGPDGRLAVSEVRGVMRFDAVSAAIAEGRMIVTLLAIAPPGRLHTDDVLPVVDAMLDRLHETVPPELRQPIAAALREPLMRLIAIERDVRRLAGIGQVREAFDALAARDTVGAAVEPHPGTWRQLCWHGTVRGLAELALDACERSVASDSSDVIARGNRGIARAVTGDREGAIADFEFVVASGGPGAWLDERVRWLRALRAGEQPFTEEVLADLLVRYP